MIPDELAALLRDALARAHAAGELNAAAVDVPVTIETPRNKLHGDYSTNLALTLKRVTGLPDGEAIARRIQAYLPASPLIERTEIARPGFLNFYLKPDWLHDTLVAIEQQDAAYGSGDSMSGMCALIEFVSANPTGPISVVNGRAAVLGDVLGNLFTNQNAHVGREFYVNDALNSLQLEKFAQTVAVRYLQQLGHPVILPPADPDGPEVIEAGAGPPGAELEPVRLPRDGYRGEYVKDIARRIVEAVGDRYRETGSAEAQTFFREATLNEMLEAQRISLEAFGVSFDTWFRESSLYESGAVDRTIAELKELGFAYEQDGALWLKSSLFGDDKDRVLVRSNEKATYVAADAAYHANKFNRGFNRLINIWGADHHGYVARLKAGVAALGFDPDALEIVLTQMVSLVRDGEAVVGGKRKGNVVELKDDLIDDIGCDAARFYFLLNSYETPATVDVELAKRESNENPVYYVQYAHARLCNILRKGVEAAIALPAALEADLTLLTAPSELDVLRKLAEYPAEVAKAASGYAPHRLTRYAMDLAGLLNIFYENCRVLPGRDSPQDPDLTAARLALVNGSRIVLRNLLGLLGVTSPDRM